MGSEGEAPRCSPDRPCPEPNDRHMALYGECYFVKREAKEAVRHWKCASCRYHVTGYASMVASARDKHLRLHSPIPSADGTCGICGKPPAQRLRRGRCDACYRYWQRHYEQDRPDSGIR